MDTLARLSLPVKSAVVKSTSKLNEPVTRPASSGVVDSSGRHPLNWGNSTQPYQPPRLWPNLDNREPSARGLPAKESRFHTYPASASSETMRPSSSLSWNSMRPSGITSPLYAETRIDRPDSAPGAPGGYFHSSQVECFPSTSTSGASPNFKLTFRDQHLPIPQRVEAYSQGDNSRTSAASFVGYEVPQTDPATPERAPAMPQHGYSQKTQGDEVEFTTPLKRTNSVLGATAPRNPEYSLTNRHPSLVFDLPRPDSAPISQSQEGESQWIPPRRELPFPKRRISPVVLNVDTLPVEQPDHERRGSKLGISMDPKAPEATTSVQNSTGGTAQYSKEDTLAQASLATTPSNGNAVPENPRVRTPLQRIQSREEEPSPLAGRTAASAHTSMTHDLVSKQMTAGSSKPKRSIDAVEDLVQNERRVKKMSDKATQTQTLSGRDHTSGYKAPATRAEPTANNDAARTRSPPQDFLGYIDSFVTKHKSRPPPVELWERSDYVGTSSEERQAVINDFIIENLENENFLKLCEDVGEVWRRIGLDM